MTRKRILSLFVFVLLLSYFSFSQIACFGPKTKQHKSFAIAVDVCTTVMDRLLASDVGFSAIDYTAGPKPGDIAKDGKVRPDCRPCAAFKSANSGLEKSVFAGLGKVVRMEGDFYRIFEKDGHRIEVYWFAGVYKDEVSAKADFKKEMTFASSKNPYHKVGNRAKGYVVMPADDRTSNPYLREPGSGGYTRATDPKDPRAQAGWPKLDSSTEPFTLEGWARKAAAPTLDFPLVVNDLRTFNEGRGLLAKMVVGVRCMPLKAAKAKAAEFWLTSLKADMKSLGGSVKGTLSSKELQMKKVAPCEIQAAYLGLAAQNHFMVKLALMPTDFNDAIKYAKGVNPFHNFSRPLSEKSNNKTLSERDQKTNPGPLFFFGEVTKLETDPKTKGQRFSRELKVEESKLPGFEKRKALLHMFLFDIRSPYPSGSPSDSVVTIHTESHNDLALGAKWVDPFIGGYEITDADIVGCGENYVPEAAQLKGIYAYDIVSRVSKEQMSPLFVDEAGRALKVQQPKSVQWQRPICEIHKGSAGGDCELKSKVKIKID